MTVARTLLFATLLVILTFFVLALRPEQPSVEAPQQPSERRSSNSGEPASQDRHEPEDGAVELARQPGLETPSRDLARFPIEDSGSSAPLSAATRCGELLRAYEEDRRLVDGQARLRGLAEIPITQDLRETPLPEVVSLLQEITQANIMINRGKIEDPESMALTWDAREVPLEQFLDGISVRLGVGWDVDEGVIVITAPSDARTSRQAVSSAVLEAAERLDRQRELLSRAVVLRGEDLPPRTVAELLAMNLGVAWNTEDLDWNDPPLLAFDGAETTAQEVVDRLKKTAGVATIYRDGVLWFATR